jgi:hypothetical protein
MLKDFTITTKTKMANKANKSIPLGNPKLIPKKSFLKNNIAYI